MSRKQTQQGSAFREHPVLAGICIFLSLVLIGLLVYAGLPWIRDTFGHTDSEGAELPAPSTSADVEAEEASPLPQKAVTAIRFSEASDPTTVLHMTPGDRKALQVVLDPKGVDAQIEWSSSDERIASVDSSGVVSCLSPGRAVITAACGAINAQLMVEIAEPEQSTPVSTGAWVDTSYGARFYVPDGFRQVPIQPAAGYVYRYYNDALQMSLFVSEIPAAACPVGETAKEVIEFDYQFSHESIMDNGWDLTYQSQTETKWVLSGYQDSGTTIFYNSEAASNDDSFVFIVQFTYPAANADTCNPMVGTFMKNFTISR